MKNTLINMRNLIKKNKTLRDFLLSLNDKLPLSARDSILRNLRNPYSEAEKRNNIIFIHVPKTAGNGIFKSLFSEPATGHDPATKYLEHDSTLFSNSFKFGFVRNPLDRFVSSFHYLKQGGFGRYDNDFSKKYLSKYNNINEFIIELDRNDALKKNILKWIHFKPQHHFLCNKNDEVMVDFLGRFETIEKDYKTLCGMLKIEPSPLRKENQSKHKHYTEYYTEETKKIILSIYKKDMEIFKYPNDTL